jgi:hypothetical protein
VLLLVVVLLLLLGPLQLLLLWQMSKSRCLLW